MKVADALHVEVVEGLQFDAAFAGARTAQNYLGALRVARSRCIVDVEIDASCEIERGAGLRARDGAELVPTRAVGVFIGVAMRADILEVRRRPQPVELGHRGRGHSRGILRPDSAHAPRAIARTPNSRRFRIVRLARNGQTATVAAMLREPRQVYNEPWTGPSRKTRLLDRTGACLEHQVGLYGFVIDAQAHRSHRAYDLDRDRADSCVHPLGAEHSRGAHAMLHAAGDDAECAIDNSDVRINSHCGGKVRLALAKITFEKKSIVKVAVAGKDLLHRLRRLMNRIVIALRDHRYLLAFVD